MSYPPQPWDLAGIGRVTIWRVPTTALPQLPGGVRPWSVGGTSLAVTAFVTYVDRPGRPSVMEYDELLAAVAVRHGRRKALSITDIWVDSPASMAGGRALWGIPKDLADLAGADGWLRATTGTGEIAAARFLPGRLPALRLPVPLRGSVVQTLAGRTVASPVRSGGRLRSARAQWHLADDGALAWLHDARPVASFLAEEFTLCFGSRLPGSAPSSAQT